MTLDELLRLVSSPKRHENFDERFGYEVYSVRGYANEMLLVDIKDYDCVDEELQVYKLKEEFDCEKYR